jgi:hypothetical protein
MSAQQHHDPVLYLGHPVVLDPVSWGSAKHGAAQMARFKTSAELCYGMWDSLEHPFNTPGFKLVSP